MWMGPVRMEKVYERLLNGKLPQADSGFVPLSENKKS